MSLYTTKGELLDDCGQFTTLEQLLCEPENRYKVISTPDSCDLAVKKFSDWAIPKKRIYTPLPKTKRDRRTEPLTTDEAFRKARKAKRRLRLIAECNLQYGNSIAITLTRKRVGDRDWWTRQINELQRTLHDQWGYKPKISRCLEKGMRGGRWHAHLIIYNPPDQTVCSLPRFPHKNNSNRSHKRVYKHDQEARKQRDYWWRIWSKAGYEKSINFIHIHRIEGRKGRKQIIRYFTDYLTKNLDRTPHRKLITHTPNVTRPDVLYLNREDLKCETGRDTLCQLFVELSGWHPAWEFRLWRLYQLPQVLRKQYIRGRKDLVFGVRDSWQQYIIKIGFSKVVHKRSSRETQINQYMRKNYGHEYKTPSVEPPWKAILRENYNYD